MSIARPAIRRRPWAAALVFALAGAPTAPRAQVAEPHPVLLYASPSTTAFYPTVGGSYDALLGVWRTLFAQRRIAVREVSQPAELARLEGGVLVLPSAVALSAAERQALLRFRDAGGSLLATWALGARDETGRWLGHGFVRELMGVAVAGEIEPEAPARFVVPYGDSPLNRSVPAGRRLWLGKLHDKPLVLQGGVAAAAYLDWSRTVMQRAAQPVAIAFDERDGSRRALFGFSETVWGFHPSDMQALAADALHWLQRQPAGHLSAWPHGRRAAQVIEIDTEDGFDNARHFAEVMESIDAVGTFYCLTSEARKHRELVRQLVQKHEVGFHGEVHVGFRAISRPLQQRRLRRMLAEMSDVLGTGPDGWPAGAGRGFRAPTESYDAVTEELLQESGFRHHTADPNSSEDRLPFFSPVASAVKASGLVVLPRGQFDDINYAQLKLSPQRVGEALVAEYELNRQMGGLGLLSVHTQNFADPDQLFNKPQHTSLMTHALENLVRYIGPRRGTVWLAPAGAVERWWRARSHAALSTRRVVAAASNNRAFEALEIELAVEGTAAVAGLTVLLHHRAEHAVPSVHALAPVMPATPESAPELRRIDRFTTALVFESLTPGAHRFRVTFP